MKKILLSSLWILFLLFSLDLYAENQININNVYWYDFSKILDKNAEFTIWNISKSDCWWICLENTLNATFINDSTWWINIEVFRNLNTKSFSWVDETFLSQRSEKLFPAIDTYKWIINWDLNISTLESKSWSISVTWNSFALETVISPKILKNNSGSVTWIWYFSFSKQDVSLPWEYYYNIFFLSKDWAKYVHISKKILKVSDVFSQKTITKINNLVWKNDKLFSQVISRLNKYVSTNKKINNVIDELIKNVNL